MLNREKDCVIIEEDQYEKPAREAFEKYLQEILGHDEFCFSREYKDQRPDYKLKFRDSQIGVEVTSVWNENSLKSGKRVPDKSVTEKLKALLQRAENMAREEDILKSSFWVCFNTLFGLTGIEDDKLVNRIVEEINRQVNEPNTRRDHSKYSRLFDIQIETRENENNRFYYSESSCVGDEVIPGLVWDAVNRAIEKKANKYPNLLEADRPVILLYDMTKWSVVDTYQSPPDGQELHSYFTDIFVVRSQTVIPLATSRFK